MPESAGVREKTDESRAVFVAYTEGLERVTKRGTLRDYKNFVLQFFDSFEVKDTLLDMIYNMEGAGININEDGDIQKVFKLYFEYEADKEFAKKTDPKRGAVFRSEEFYMGQMTAKG